ncbi:hypothetical protein ES703_22311 [subsurface metagenome]
MKKILLYHGLREGKKHVVTSAEGTFYEPGEMPANIFDVHPSDEELKRRAKEENRPELAKDRKVEM